MKQPGFIEGPKYMKETYLQHWNHYLSPSTEDVGSTTKKPTNITLPSVLFEASSEMNTRDMSAVFMNMFTHILSLSLSLSPLVFP